jgi:glucose/arabinose dehydrogenase
MANFLCNVSIVGAWVPSDFCAYPIPVTIDQARTVLAIGEADFLALERGTESVVYFHDTNGDGLADARHVVATASSLNHGLDVYNGHLYASSDSQVYRWPLSNNSFLEAVGVAEMVIDNINADGVGGAPQGHTTRTLAFDDFGRLYVSVGSYDNIDNDSFRSRIRRFDLGNDSSSFPLDFLGGQVFADGLRNEVGLSFDRHGDLWGVENSADKLDRQDLGGDVLTEDNPVRTLQHVAWARSFLGVSS